MNLNKYLRWLFDRKPFPVLAICAGITDDVTLDCDEPLVGGVNDRLLLWNFNDATYTRNGTNTNIIEAVTFDTTTRAYQFEGKNNSHEPRAALVKSRYAETYEHEVVFKIFSNSPDIKSQIENMAKGRIVALVQNNFVNGTGNSAFEIYGVDAGMELVELERTPTETETQGSWNLILRTSEFSREGHLPASFFLTNYAASLALVDAMIV